MNPEGTGREVGKSFFLQIYIMYGTNQIIHFYFIFRNHFVLIKVYLYWLLLDFHELIDSIFSFLC